MDLAYSIAECTAGELQVATGTDTIFGKSNGNAGNSGWFMRHGDRRPRRRHHHSPHGYGHLA
ncbi:MAG: hypothetical protein ACOCY6_03935 [Halodesulfurarchaeum sp.]